MQKVALVHSTTDTLRKKPRLETEQTGLVGFYDIRQETERVYSFNPGVHTGLLFLSK